MAHPTSKYCPLTVPEIEAEVKELEILWNNFIKRYEKTIYKDYLVDKDDLLEVITRVDKRKDYYYYYHDIDDGNMSEYKEVALKAYWIIKLKPFRMISPLSDLHNYVNEQFALYLIFSILHIELQKEGYSLLLPKEKYINDILYSMKYHDISKEAMIDIVDSIAEITLRQKNV